MNRRTTIGIVVAIVAIAIADYFFYPGNNNTNMPTPTPTTPVFTPTPTPTPTITPTAKNGAEPRGIKPFTPTPTITPTPTPIPLSEAYAIAVEYLETHFPNVLTEGVLIAQYYNPDFNRFVFQWSHRKGILYSEPELAVVWVSDTGEILKVSITWSPFEPSLLALTREDCVRMESRVRAVENKSIRVMGYWRINKVRYFSYENKPLKDWYWVGVSRSWNPHINETFLDNVLIDEDGHIVGQSYLPP